LRASHESFDLVRLRQIGIVEERSYLVPGREISAGGLRFGRIAEPVQNDLTALGG
jgi:hypothetical protein